MFPCCDLCYKKYINKDDSIDEQRLRWAKLEYAKTFKRTIILDDIKWCTCECHQDGVNLMH